MASVRSLRPLPVGHRQYNSLPRKVPTWEVLRTTAYEFYGTVDPGRYTRQYHYPLCLCLHFLLPSLGRGAQESLVIAFKGGPGNGIRVLFLMVFSLGKGEG